MLTTQLTPADLLHCTRRLPPAVTSVLKEFHGRLFLAGGFIRAVISGEEVADIDLIAATPEVASEAAERLRVIQNLPSGPPDGPRRMHTSGNAYTVSGLGRVPVQIIHRWTYSQVELALAEFDFTIACAGIYWDGISPDAGHWTSAAHSDYSADLAAKRLVYQAPARAEDAGGSMLRVLKFVRRGYSIPLDSLGAVLARISRGVNPGTWMAQDEKGLAAVFTGLLREVDPLVDPDHIAH